MRQVTNDITVAVKKGSIFDNLDIRLASLRVRGLKIEEGLLTFQSKTGDEKKDGEGKVIKVNGKPVIENTKTVTVEILEEELQLLIVDGVTVFPIIEEDEDDLE